MATLVPGRSRQACVAVVCGIIGVCCLGALLSREKHTAQELLTKNFCSLWSCDTVEVVSEKLPHSGITPQAKPLSIKRRAVPRPIKVNLVKGQKTNSLSVLPLSHDAPKTEQIKNFLSLNQEVKDDEIKLKAQQRIIASQKAVIQQQIYELQVSAESTTKAQRGGHYRHSTLLQGQNETDSTANSAPTNRIVDTPPTASDEDPDVAEWHASQAAKDLAYAGRAAAAPPRVGAVGGDGDEDVARWHASQAGKDGKYAAAGGDGGWEVVSKVLSTDPDVARWHANQAARDGAYAGRVAEWREQADAEGRAADDQWRTHAAAADTNWTRRADDARAAGPVEFRRPRPPTAEEAAEAAAATAAHPALAARAPAPVAGRQSGLRPAGGERAKAAVGPATDAAGRSGVQALPVGPGGRAVSHAADAAAGAATSARP